MAALRRAFDLDVAEGWESYRRLRDHLDRPVGLVDLDRHPRIVAGEVRAARLALVRAEARDIEVPVTRAEARVLEQIEREEAVEMFEEFELTATTKGYTPRRR